MARGYTTRKLEVWSLHAHVERGAVRDYAALLGRIARMRPASRTWATPDRAIAIPFMAIEDGVIELTAYEGPVGQPIVFDTAHATERVQPLGPGEIVATRTHVLIDPGSREAIVEYNHRGAKASDIAAVLGESGRKLEGMRSLFIDLTPKVDESFAEAIDDFRRIRVAGLRIARPNYDWTDWDDALSESADDSNAQTAQAEFTARRGETLAKKKGIVPFIKKRAREAAPSLKNAFVTGTREGEAAETSVTIGDHKEHQRVSVRMDEENQVDETDIIDKIRAYHSSRRAKRRRARR